MAINRIEKILYSQKFAATVVLMKDGSNYILPMIRDTEAIARFCGAARKGNWGMSLKPEGLDILLAAPDLQTQEMSF